MPTEPRPGEPLILTKEEVCLLFPLSKTKVWSVPRPLNCAGSTWSVPSAVEVGLLVKEGAT